MLRCELLGETRHSKRLMNGTLFATDMAILSADWPKIRLSPDLPAPNSYIKRRMCVQVWNSLTGLPFLIDWFVTVRMLSWGMPD